MYNVGVIGDPSVVLIVHESLLFPPVILTLCLTPARDGFGVGADYYRIFRRQVMPRILLSPKESRSRKGVSPLQVFIV